MSEKAGPEEILSTLQVLFTPGQVIEVRTIGDDGISSGYYDNFEKAAQDILNLDKIPRISGIYVTLNEINPVLLGRRANRIKTRVGRQDPLTADADIIRRQWLPIDVDPKRPSGISSSESEHADALVLADTIRQYLSGIGWPDPVVGDSGNGAHLLYPIDLPNDKESKQLIQSVLEFLDARFSDNRCKVDTGVSNAGRIWKIYGTMARKGDPLVDRPHRRARIITVHGHLQVLSREALCGLPITAASISAETQSPSGSESEAGAFNLGTWLDSNHLTYTAKPYLDGTLFVLDACPFSSAHTDGAFAIQFGNGAIFAGCHHNSCGGGKQRWPELRAMFEPEKPDTGARLARLRSQRIREKHEAEGRVRLSESELNQVSKTTTTGNEESEDSANDSFPLVRIRSREILQSGNPLAYLLDTFGSYHEGDQTVAECLIHSLVSRSVINSKGLHVSITGESGKGKSHAIETMRSLIPEHSRLDGRLSDKALFYMEDLRAGTVITLDDVGLSDQLQEILKGVTTSFQRPFLYRTVNKDRKPQVCTIPERCVWWIAKVEGAGDDQVFNRMLTCWIDDSEEQDLKVLSRTLADAGQMPGRTQVSEDVLVSRQIWEDISPVWVVIPYATRIRFQSIENRRNPDMLLDLIRTHAAIFQHQRERRVIDGTCCVIANLEDFAEAARLFSALNGEHGGQINKLTKREFELISHISSSSLQEIPITELQDRTGLCNSTICKLIHGYRSKGKSYTGILAKCPAISYLDRTVVKGDEGYTTLRRNRVYLWNQVLYDSWVKGGSVWLSDSDESAQEPPDGSDGGSPQGNSPDSAINSGNTSDRSGVEESIPEEENDARSDTGVLVSDEDIAGVADPDTENAEHHLFISGESASRENSSNTRERPPFVAASLSSIIPQNFRKIDGFPEKSPCSVCGRKPT